MLIDAEATADAITVTATDPATGDSVTLTTMPWRRRHRPRHPALVA